MGMNAMSLPMCNRLRHRSVLCGAGRCLVITMLALCARLAPAHEKAHAPDGARPPSEFAVDPDPRDDVRICPVEAAAAPRDGGMAGDGWDGPGLQSVLIAWHVDGTTDDLGAGQRNAIITALQAYADVVQIVFWELPVTNRDVGIDWDFVVLDHSVSEPQEEGDPDCPFDGPGGTLAHAGFPPGVSSTCIDPMAETFSGNVHFDDDEEFEEDVGDPDAFSLTYIAVHELGHSLGLVHSSDPNDVMYPFVDPAQGFNGLSPGDIDYIRSGYAEGTGAVITLNETGVWVDKEASGIEVGTEAFPFDTVIEGVNGVPPFSTGVVVHIETGVYSETMTISQNMVLEAENGTVTIGQ